MEKLLSQSEPEIQERIEKIVDVLELARADSNSKVPVLREAQSLMESATDHDEIVKQIAIFAAAPDADERQRLMAPVVLQLLQLRPLLQLRHETVIRVLAPYLDDSDNRALRSFSRSWFRAHDKGGSDESPLKPVNFGDYLKYVRGKLNKEEEVPIAFVEYLFERSSNRALLLFHRADRRDEMVARLMEMRRQEEAERQKLGQDELDRRDDELAARLAEWNKKMAALRGEDPPPPLTQPRRPLPVTDLPGEIPRQREKIPQKKILLAEHIISNAIWLKKKKFDERFQEALPEAKQQLANLAEHDRWWARFYVVQIMRRNHELRLDDVLHQLSRDSNVVVSKSAKLVLGQ